jgi:flagella basal body P-ring formation protein FlgA
MARVRTPIVTVLALALSGIAFASDAPGSIEQGSLDQKLREQRADVVRWETQPLAAADEHLDRAADIVAVGRIGPRTPVRYADGRTRWFAVAGFRQVLVVTRPVDSGAQVLADHAASAERDVIALACEPISRLDDAKRWRATRRLATGEALCVGSVEIAPAVERDRPVTLTTQHGVVSASRVLTATTDAHAGEVVRLRDPASGATVIAIVTGSRTARVSEEQK